MRAERFWLVVAIALTGLLLVAVLLTLAVVSPPSMEPVPLPTASAL